ncbi:related to Putative mitochondrial repair protein [Cephalotrichum gorgonifer]|uniref:Related to Putative mitochondrial repair protein n=1 Tax=Cephalotrichum gorgonifer TaxID=2041049 RepID=A0AAE8MZ41_9PEZI|nr:related to Putative mitochondrial repair protein [Cephalotrichum gorgonifer]
MRPRLPIVRIANGTFYRTHPNSLSSHANPPLFANLNFEIASASDPPQNWCVVGPSLSGKTTLLHLLRGRLLCEPPTARSFPYLSTDAVPHDLKTPDRAIQYVGFDGEQMGAGLSGGVTTSAYISARYESRREITDFSLRDYLMGNTELNPLNKKDAGAISSKLFERSVTNLRLDPLLDLPVAFLSNGQGRRARIAKALLATPEVLLLDEPFMGLDPPTVRSLDPLLGSLAEEANPRLVLSARPQDELPKWITHILYLKGDCQVEAMGPRDEVLAGHHEYSKQVWTGGLRKDQDQAPAKPAVPGKETSRAEVVVELDGCQVKYGDKIALGNWTQPAPAGEKAGLSWTVRRGDRWAVFGPNGSGKTTLVSLLCSDHPQTYSLPIKLFGSSRVPEPGSGERVLTFWDIQSRIGHSSPEVHQHMPRNLTVRKVIENAWADTFKSIPKLDGDASAKVEAALRWFAPELHPSYASAKDPETDLSWADEYLLGELSFSAQRVALLIRAMIKGPDIVVLDEAFSGMDEPIRDKCTLFLTHGEEKTIRDGEVVDSDAKAAGAVKVKGLTDQQALVCISHIKEEVPECVREWMCLPEANSELPARFGRLERPLRSDDKGWMDIWGL